MCHEPSWIWNSYHKVNCGSNAFYLLSILEGKVAIRIAGDIHNYTRHVPIPPQPGQKKETKEKPGTENKERKKPKKQRKKIQRSNSSGFISNIAKGYGGIPMISGGDGGSSLYLEDIVALRSETGKPRPRDEMSVDPLVAMPRTISAPAFRHRLPISAYASMQSLSSAASLADGIEGDSAIDDWGVKAVCEWLDSIGLGAHAATFADHLIDEIGRAVQQECRDRSRMPSSA
eukprot:TRINITY_DN4209_c0_g1_i3.p1 TRINITY_DN4209_c0_g1~~TRINITY_DN4209_c0_g1_i3.p1  ORF type:complete len:265 (+),score=28.90 TRINITY_DN4209_c0_g1_i3:104-796(+)